MEAMLREPHNEFPEFPAALAFMPVITPAQVRTQLMARLLMLERDAVAMESSLRQLRESFGMPRLFVIEDEFRLALVRAELAWVTSFVADLAAGSMSWSAAQIKDWVADIEAKVGPMSGGTQADRPPPSAPEAALE